MKLFLMLPLLILMLACNPAMNNFIAAKKENDDSAKKSSDADADAERVDVPNNITGSYLMCSLRKDATTTDVSSEYGCRLNEAGTMNQLDLSPYQSRIHWKSNLQEGIAVHAYPSNSVWHALYSITANDLPGLREKAARLQIQVQWFDSNGIPVSTFKDQKLIEILQPADAAGDSSAPVLQEQGLDPTDPGTL